MAKEDSSGNSSGVASIILSILGLSFVLLTFFAFLAPLAGLGLSITALFFARAQNKVSRNNWSKWGMILAIIGIILNGIVVIILLTFVFNAIHSYQELCNAAGGCDKIPQYIQQQQASGALQQYATP